MGDKESLTEYLAIAVEAAKIAGDVIRQGFYQIKHVEHKGQVDLVTETDKACEELIFNHLKNHFPNHKLIGEETSALCGTAELTDDPTWIVDPLDGTTNFVHGILCRFPFVCVSIGLTIGKVPTVGVVYNPIMNELFTAIHGKGAFLNGTAIKASSQTELLTALLATEVFVHYRRWAFRGKLQKDFPQCFLANATRLRSMYAWRTTRDFHFDEKAGTKRDKSTVDATTNKLNSLLFKVRSLRMTGSCALNLCGIACGRLDLFYEHGFGGPWDVAGGVVIVQEAGGLVFDPSGGEFDVMSQRVAASNSHLKDVFISALQGADENHLP